MTHQVVHIKASPKQISKMRNGHKVRINSAIEGEGCNLIIHPHTYDTVSRSFNRGKGVQIQLSPEEIAMNREHSGAIGGGIFGKRFDDMVSRRLGNRAKDVIYKSADKYVKPLLKKDVDNLILLAPKLGASAGASAATLSGNPEFAPVAGAAGYKGGEYVSDFLNRYGKDYLDHPGKYQSNAGGPRHPVAPTLQGQAQHNEELAKMNRHLGTQYGALSNANLQNANAHRRRARMTQASIEGQTQGMGIRERSTVGRGGSMVGSQTHLPPALQSQPFSANFQFQHFLPPAYQKFSKGGGLYA